MWRRVLEWHYWGIFFGAAGLGLGYAVESLARGHFGRAATALIWMTGIAIMVLTALTPVALVLLGIWTGLAALMPALERRPVLRLATLSSLALALTVPLSITFMLAFGTGRPDDPRTPLAIVTESLWREWPVLFLWVPAAFGWLLAPRLFIKRLRPALVSLALLAGSAAVLPAQTTRDSAGVRIIAVDRSSHSARLIA